MDFSFAHDFTSSIMVLTTKIYTVTQLDLCLVFTAEIIHSQGVNF